MNDRLKGSGRDYNQFEWGKSDLYVMDLVPVHTISRRDPIPINHRVCADLRPGGVMMLGSSTFRRQRAPAR